MSYAHPIAFLPGIMGTRLYFPACGLYWDPDDPKRMIPWLLRSPGSRRVEMHASRSAIVPKRPSARGVPAHGRSLGWGGPAWSFYGVCLKSLHGIAANGQAHAFGYDWRQDMRWMGSVVANQVVDLIDQTQASKVAIVTHSMGGLVLRCAFRHAPWLMNYVERVVQICPPSTGAVLLYRRLFTGMVAGIDGAGKPADRILRTLLGTSQIEFQANISGQPAAIQLAPTEGFPVDHQNQAWHSMRAQYPSLANLYWDSNSPPGVDDANIAHTVAIRTDYRSRIQDAIDFDAYLGQPTDPTCNHPRTWLIHGTGLATETRIAITGGVLQRHCPNLGDGTVPEVSSRALGLPPSQVLAVPQLEHSVACNDAMVQTHLQTIFQTP